MSEPLYSVGTWNESEQAFTPQVGLTVPSQNVPWRTLLQILRELRQLGYSAHYRRDPDGDHDDNDACVLVERTNGRPLDGQR